VPLPGDFRVFGDLAALRPQMLDRPTVIKPDRGADNRGVLPLVPAGRGRWRDLAHDTTFDFDGLREALAREIVDSGVSDNWLGEELLVAPDGGLPRDVKYLTFRGALSVQFIRTNVPKRFRWFDAEWHEVASGLAEHTIDPSIEPPSTSPPTPRSRCVCRRPFRCLSCGWTCSRPIAGRSSAS
jgi:hypothetical protein